MPPGNLFDFRRSSLKLDPGLRCHRLNLLKDVRCAVNLSKKCKICAQCDECGEKNFINGEFFHLSKENFSPVSAE